MSWRRLGLYGHAASQARSGRWLAAHLGVDQETACRWITFWAALHDVGKASPGFQGKWPQTKSLLEGQGYDFRPLTLPAPHGTVTAATLPRFLVASVSSGGARGKWRPPWLLPRPEIRVPTPKSCFTTLSGLTTAF